VIPARERSKIVFRTAALDIRVVLDALSC